MITREQTTPRIIFEGISVEDFFARLEQFKTVETKSDNSDEVFTVDQASAFLKLSTPTLHRLKAANAIPFTKIGARVIYRKSELIKWMNEKTNQTKVVRK